MQDNRIVELLQKRNEQALSEIRRKYSGLCFRIAKQMLNTEDAEECVNDMLLAVWNSIPPHEPKNLEAYLVTLLRRAATDRLRTLHRLKRGGAQLTETLDELAEVIPSHETVESEVDGRALTKAIQAFLDAQTEKSRSIFMERYYFSQPVKKIAETHEMSVSAVNVMLHRIRKQLKKHLGKEGFF